MSTGPCIRARTYTYYCVQVWQEGVCALARTHRSHCSRGARSDVGHQRNNSNENDEKVKDVKPTSPKGPEALRYHGKGEFHGKDDCEGGLQHDKKLLRSVAHLKMRHGYCWESARPAQIVSREAQSHGVSL